MADPTPRRSLLAGFRSSFLTGLVVVLPVGLYGRIAENSAAEVETEVPAKARYKAKVQIVDKVVDSASGTFGVRLELPNPGGKIPAGVKCLVRFP